MDRWAQGSTRGADRQGSTWRRSCRTLRGDGTIGVVGNRDRRAEDREHPGPAPCADVQHCNEESTFAEWIADATRTAESVRVASAIHSANVDSSLQCWTSAHGAGPGCSRSSARLSRLPTTPIVPSPRRVLHDLRQVDPWRSAPRVLPCAHRSVTQYLRTTPLVA